MLGYLYIRLSKKIMPDKVEVTVAIEEYRLEMEDFIRKYKAY